MLDGFAKNFFAQCWMQKYYTKVWNQIVLNLKNIIIISDSEVNLSILIYVSMVYDVFH